MACSPGNWPGRWLIRTYPAMASRNSTAVPSTMTFQVNDRRRRWVRNCSRRLTRGADGSYLLGWTEVRLLKASSQLTRRNQHVHAAENYNMGTFGWWRGALRMW